MSSSSSLLPDRIRSFAFGRVSPCAIRARAGTLAGWCCAPTARSSIGSATPIRSPLPMERDATRFAGSLADPPLGSGATIPIRRSAPSTRYSTPSRGLLPQPSALLHPSNDARLRTSPGKSGDRPNARCSSPDRRAPARPVRRANARPSSSALHPRHWRWSRDRSGSGGR